MSWDSNSFNTGCDETKANLEKDYTEVDGICVPREDKEEEQSTLFSKSEGISGTKGQEETKFNRHITTSKTEGRADRDTDHVNNGENMDTSKAEQPEDKFLPEEVSGIL